MARVTLSGVRYPLSRAVLLPGSRGLSNVARGSVSLVVHSGRVWAMSPQDRLRVLSGKPA
jgi:hypothetical protein